MRKFVIAALVAATTAVAAAPAQAQEIDYDLRGPCSTTFRVMEYYGIQLGMHNEDLEWALRTVCGVTG
jgi:hypothetical protein